MKKHILLSSLLIGGFSLVSFSQCCNVVASNGSPVTTSSGNCIVMTNSADCSTALTIESKDSDGDGVSDDKDKCPETKGSSSNNGCPEINAEIWTLFNNELKDVKFSNKSDSLTGNSEAKLQNVASLLKNNKDYKLKVSGYTDSVGTDADNKILSQKRATAVKRYLTSNGIPEKRVAVAAYGEKFPERSNQTAAGRSENRRVEFDLFY